MTYTPRDHVNQGGQACLRLQAGWERQAAVVAGLIEAHLPDLAFKQVRELSTWRRAEIEALTKELIAHEQGLVAHITADEERTHGTQTPHP